MSIYLLTLCNIISDACALCNFLEFGSLCSIALVKHIWSSRDPNQRLPTCQIKIITQLSKQGYVAFFYTFTDFQKSIIDNHQTVQEEMSIKLNHKYKKCHPHTHVPTSKSNISNHQKLYGTIKNRLRVWHGILQSFNCNFIVLAW